MKGAALIRTPWHRRIVTQALALQLGVIAFVLLIVSFSFARIGRAALEEQYGLRAQAVAESVAEIPEIRELVAAPSISPRVQEIAEAVRIRTNVDFVVVTDAGGIRHSHPNPDRIGHAVSTDPGRALAGISDWYVETGTLGLSVRGKVPIWDADGDTVVGIVSVGVLAGELSDTMSESISGLVLMMAAAFGAGAIAAYVGARRIRRSILGLEPPEIAALFEHRDGLLRALHEGVLAIDGHGRVTLVNDEAATMLGLEKDDLGGDGRRLHDLPHLRPLLDLAAAPTAMVDVPFEVGTQTLLVTSAPISLRGERDGAVFTFRDRTELQGLVSDLESAQGLIDALRAQAHEHSNDLHTIAGLIELGQHESVLSVVKEHSAVHRELADLFDHRRAADSLLVASLLSKVAAAGERDVRLMVHLGELPHTEMRFSRDLVTVIGNLVDNAVEHVSESHSSMRDVEVAVWFDGEAVRADVSDSGDGIGPDVTERIFERGFTTKDSRSHDGLGLALVSDVVRGHGGWVRVDSEPGCGALFSVSIPVAARKEPIDA